jgi:hypothetical protein
MARDLHRASEREKEREREAFLRYEGKAGRVEKKEGVREKGQFRVVSYDIFCGIFLYVI